MSRLIRIVAEYTYQLVTYCKSGNFRYNFIFANSVKRHICDVKNSRKGPDLPTSVNDRVILPFREGFIFTKLRNCEVSRNYSPRENYRIYSMLDTGERHCVVPLSKTNLPLLIYIVLVQPRKTSPDY